MPLLNRYPFNRAANAFDRDAAFGELYATGNPNATGTVITPGTPTLVLGATALDLFHDMDSPSAGRLRHTGESARLFSVVINMSSDIISGSTSTVLLSIAKNDEVIVKSTNARRMAGGTGGAAIGSHGANALVELEPGDYIEPYMDADNNITCAAIYYTMTAFVVPRI